MENTTKKDNTVFGMEYWEVALGFALLTLAVVVGVWGASKISQ